MLILKGLTEKQEVGRTKSEVWSQSGEWPGNRKMVAMWKRAQPRQVARAREYECKTYVRYTLDAISCQEKS